MLHTLLIAAGLAALPAVSAAADHSPGYVKYAVAARSFSPGVLQKRQSEVGLAQQQSGLSYTITLMIGTPGQKVTVQIDTGSSHLWVNPDCDNSQLSPLSIPFCHSLGRFDPTQSSTNRNLSQLFVAGYGGGNASLSWVTDDISVGSITLKAQQFGVAYQSYREPFGILGLGANVFSNDPKYALFLDNLVIQKVIQSRAFSLDLRGIESPDGSVIFGGVDTGKYVGALEKLPMVQTVQENIAKTYAVNLDSISVSNGQTSARISNRTVTVLLDSGSSLSYLPPDMYQALVQRFPGAKLNTLTGDTNIDCAIVNQTGSILFTFAGKTIAVGLKDFVVKDKFTGLCQLGVASGAEPNLILGDTVLRAAYVVYDLDNQNIHVAQAANCGTNIVPIGKGPNAVPSVPGQCSSTSPTAGQPTPTYLSAAARPLSSVALGAVIALAVAVLL